MNGRNADVNGWSGTTASLRAGIMGNYFRMNINNPASEQTYLKVENDGSIFSNLGERIICGGWMQPTTYSVGNTYTPLFSTRGGPGQPIFYLSLIRGLPRMMLYNSSGTLILDTSVTPPFTFQNGVAWTSAALTFTGELNRSCTADLIFGMLSSSYWYAGGFDDWFLDTDSSLTAEELRDYFYASLCANGGDTTGDVD